MYFGMESGFTLTLLLAGIVIAAFAQIKVTSAFNKYKKVNTKKGLNGSDVARMILEKNGLNNIYVVETNGELTDHYNPNSKTVKLSKEVYRGETIAALAVAAHEVGHAIQDKENYTFMRIRAALVPFVNFVSYLGYFAVIVSIFAGITGYLQMSICVLLATLLFQLVTLPVEFDASRRAKEELEKLGLVSSSEQSGVKKMLNAAAFTYVASLITTLLQLLRLVILLNDRRD